MAIRKLKSTVHDSRSISVWQPRRTVRCVGRTPRALGYRTEPRPPLTGGGQPLRASEQGQPARGGRAVGVGSGAHGLAVGSSASHACLFLTPSAPHGSPPGHPPWPPAPLGGSLCLRRNWPGSWSRWKTRRSSLPPCATSPGPWRRSSRSSGEQVVVAQGPSMSKRLHPF